MALAMAARTEPGGAPPAAAMRSWAPSGTRCRLPVHEREHPVDARELQQPVDGRVPADDRQVVAVATRVAVPPREQGESRRVHELQAAQVDHEPSRAPGPRRAQALLENRDGAQVELAGRADERGAVALVER